MDSKKVFALLTAIERGSLTSAADELGYTQSGLTHMMNSLEEELGIGLLVRNKSGVRLSAAGTELLPRLHAFVESAEQLEKEARRLQNNDGSTLRLGTYSSIALHWLPEILTRYRVTCPDVQVSLNMNGISDLFNAVRNDELDCAMLSYQKELFAPGMEWIPLREDELLAILPSTYEYNESEFTSENFGGEYFLMPSSGFEMDINPVFSSGGKNVLPDIHRTNLDDASILSMVEHGLGVSVMSRLVMQGMKYNVKALPLVPKAYRSLGIIVNERRMNDRHIKKLLNCAKDVVAAKYAGK